MRSEGQLTTLDPERGSGPPRRRQAERTALSEGKLLAAALQLISERGYDRMTLQAVGDAAGYSRGLVSHRFGSKEGLLWVLLERMFEHWSTESLKPKLGPNVGIEALHAVVETTRASVHRTPERVRAFYALMFESLGPLPALRPKMAEFHRRQRASVAEWIAAGVRAGSVRADVDAAAQAGLFISAIRGAAYQWLIDPEVDVDAIYDEIKATVTRNLQRSPT